jgi:two-component system, cell cycle response regulator DivK
VTAPSPGMQEPLVLIVDDSAVNLKLARDVLGAAGFRTLEAASAAEAIALTEAELPDVILMDVRLPDMSGADAAKALGSRKHTAHIPVVALSALALESDTDWQLAGCAGHVTTPIDVGRFPEQVRRYCVQHGS